jgi:drug/metabolite transporter (DMT)-like permease
MDSITKKIIIKPTVKVRAILAFACISVVWGSTWAVGKQGLLQIPVLPMAYLRHFIAGAIIVSYFLVKGYGLPTMMSMKKSIVLSLFLFVFNTGFSIWGLQFIPSHTAAFIGCTSPLFIYFFQVILGCAKMNTSFIIGCLVSIVGVAILIMNGRIITQQGYWFGIFLSFVAVIAWCVGFVMLQPNKDPTHTCYSIGWQLLFSSIILYAFAVVTGNTFPLADIDFKGWVVLGYLSIFGSVLAFICLAYIIKHLSNTVSSLYVFINPLVAVAISILLLNQPPTLLLLIGSLVTIFGIGISVKMGSSKIVCDPIKISNPLIYSNVKRRGIYFLQCK